MQSPTGKTLLEMARRDERRARNHALECRICNTLAQCMATSETGQPRDNLSHGPGYIKCAVWASTTLNMCNERVVFIVRAFFVCALEERDALRRQGRAQTDRQIDIERTGAGGAHGGRGENA
jgi:hypothetical protein